MSAIARALKKKKEVEESTENKFESRRKPPKGELENG
jgi:hypothetical protein